MRTLLLAILIFTVGLGERVRAVESWQDALSRMPLGRNVTELKRTNGIPLMLNAFQSNSVIKALIFMPGAADDFVFYRRAHATLTNANPSLLDAVTALTNQTHIRAEFRSPFLLLYTTEDTLGPIATIKNNSTATKLQARVVPGRIYFCDGLWDSARAVLRKKLSVSVRPFANAPDAEHIWPANFTAYGLTQWELLEAVARSTKTTFTLHWLTVDFRLDARFGEVQNLNAFPKH